MSFKHLNAYPLSPDKAIVVLAVIVGSQGVQTKNVIDVTRPSQFLRGGSKSKRKAEQGKNKVSARQDHATSTP